MLRKLKNIMWYAGVDRISFERIIPKIQKVNLTMVTILSTFATLLIATMFLTSFKSNGISQNRTVYLIGLILSVIILIFSITIAKKNPAFVTILVSLSYSIYYLYGIFIGTITDPDRKTVTFMVMLVFMPILFIERPLHMISITYVHVILFIILCLLKKSGATLSVDVIDAIVFSILGTSSGVVINKIKVRGYTLEQKLHEISRIDQLTKIRNRNAYEVEKDSIPDICRTSLCCIYIDVNGLHEINNEKGHESGDNMLKFIATEVERAFPSELSYRIGGDEFVAFAPDKNSEEIEGILQQMIANIEKKNYHIAVGYEISKVRLLSIDNLISEAEKKMINDKKLYYKNLATRDARIKKDNTDM